MKEQEVDPCESLDKEKGAKALEGEGVLVSSTLPSFRAFVLLRTSIWIADPSFGEPEGADLKTPSDELREGQDGISILAPEDGENEEGRSQPSPRPFDMPSSFPSPLQSTNSLSNLDSFDLTPSIGTEFSSSTQLSSLLTQPGAVKDLAILVSQRGVVFFWDQVLSTKDQLQLVTVLGEESGKPKESGLHVHPTTEETSELGSEVRTITPGK